MMPFIRRRLAPGGPPEASARRRFAPVRIALAAVLGALALGASSVPSASACANEARRLEQGSTFLPECRAYEMVSPVNKNNYDTRPQASHARISEAGDAVTYDAIGPLPETGELGTSLAPRYLAKRGPGGWTTTSIDPPHEAHFLDISFGFMGELQDPAWFSPDLSQDLLENYKGALTPEASPADVGLYSRDLSASTVSLLTQTAVFGKPWIVGVSSDRQHVVFETFENLTSQTTGEEAKLYEWSRGVVRLVGILPNGTPATSSVAGSMSAVFSSFLPWRVMSQDGSRIFFSDSSATYEEGSPQGQLYMREGNGTPSARTLWIDESEKTTPEATLKGALFREATADGSKALFTTAAQLLDEDTNATTDLYRYDVGGQAGHRLTLLSKSTSGEEATVEGVLGSSEDGEVVYFVTLGRLLSQAPLAPNHYQVYKWDHGTVSYVATLSPPGGANSDTEGVVQESFDREDWALSKSGESGATSHLARVSPDGRYLLFRSSGPVTSYKSENIAEVYLYDSLANEVRCLSCPPSGAAPAGLAYITGGRAALIGADDYQPRSLIDPEGHLRVFFESTDALLPNDTNGRIDVYEYDGDTHSLSLISNGQANRASWFLDATLSGGDVILGTTAQLVGSDRDELYDVYDARIGGGFAVPASAVECAGEACQGEPAPPPALAAPGSVSLTDQGNSVPAAKSALAHRHKPSARRRGAVHKKKARRRRHRRARHAHRIGNR